MRTHGSACRRPASSPPRRLSSFSPSSTWRRVGGPEHEVVDEELRAPPEKIRQRGASLVGLESIVLLDANPRQRLPPPRQLVAAPRVLLLRLEQVDPRCKPILPCPGAELAG